MTPSLRRALGLALKAAVTAALLTLALRAVEPDAVLARVRAADPLLLAGSALLLIMGGFAGAASWFFVLRTRLSALGYGEVAAWHWSGMFFNIFLPSNTGGDVVKGYIAARAQGQAAFVVGSLLLDRLLNLGALCAIGGCAWLARHARPLWAVAFLLLVLLALLAASAVARAHASAAVRAPRPGWAGRLDALLAPALTLFAAPRRAAPALLAALASQLCKTLNNAFLIAGLGLAVPLADMAYLIPLFGVVSALPVTVGGLGLRELVARGVAGPLALEGTDLVSLSLAGHLMVVGVNLLGALPFLLGGGRRPRDGRASG